VVESTTEKLGHRFLDAVKKCMAAGVTPIIVGGADEWPLHFYPVLLMMRILGKDGMAAAYKGDNGGFAGPGVVKAWSMYKELCDLDPFQNGFQAAKYPDAAGGFHDGKAAFHLMGCWDLDVGKQNSATKERLPDEKLGWFFFPEVKGGMGKANDIFASLNGWLVSKDAPKETVDFMKVWLTKDVQTDLAAEGLIIPMVKGTGEAIRTPFLRQLAQEVKDSGWIGIAMDQLLGPDTGRLFNDQAAAIAAKATTPEKATKAIQDSFAKTRM
jgi:raffinose/stachyose/melibiose transport system substrate-binding protein